MRIRTPTYSRTRVRRSHPRSYVSVRVYVGACNAPTLSSPTHTCVRKSARSCVRITLVRHHSGGSYSKSGRAGRRRLPSRARGGPWARGGGGGAVRAKSRGGERLIAPRGTGPGPLAGPTPMPMPHRTTRSRIRLRLCPAPPRSALPHAAPRLDYAAPHFTDPGAETCRRLSIITTVTVCKYLGIYDVQHVVIIIHALVLFYYCI